LREIAGVGAALEARLGELGIRTPAQLAKRDAKDLAAGLGISEKRADDLRAAANKHLGTTARRRR
jgi:predicted flap endonuclease-1-like 5' DNA nuclease